MTRAYLSLGTNLGDKTANLNIAIRLIGELAGEVTAVSSFLETEPWGFVSDNSFLNAAVCIETELSPFDLLHVTESIERTMGRKRKSTKGIDGYEDRIIDIDILLYGDLKINSDRLTIPHEKMTQREFVMRPLKEIKTE